jgi:uncharacterized protein
LADESTQHDDGGGALRSRGHYRRWLKRGALVVGLGALLLNALTFGHAWSFMHFAGGGERPGGVASLSWAQKVRYLCTGARMPRPENRKTPREQGLAYETVRFLGHADTSLEAWLVPHPAARGQVLLFHGYADAKASLLPVARAFHTFGYTVLLVDFYGSGGSTGNSTSVGFFEAEDVVAARRAMGASAANGPTVLYGASMGAAAVLRAVGELHIPADALVLECPFDCLLTTVEHRFELMHVPSFPAARLLLFWGGLQQGFDAAAFAPADSARAISMPTLLMVGDRDRYVSVGETRRILAGLRGAKRLEIFPGAAHQNLLRADRVRWTRVTSEFLDALGKQARAPVCGLAVRPSIRQAGQSRS